MFYSIDVLGRNNSELSRLWIAGTIGVRRMSKAQIAKYDVAVMCHSISHPVVPLALPTQATLLRGVVRLEEKQTSYLRSDAADVRLRMLTARHIIAQAKAAAAARVAAATGSEAGPSGAGGAAGGEGSHTARPEALDAPAGAGGYALDPDSAAAAAYGPGAGAGAGAGVGYDLAAADLLLADVDFSDLGGAGAGGRDAAFAAARRLSAQRAAAAAGGMGAGALGLDGMGMGLDFDAALDASGYGAGMDDFNLGGLDAFDAGSAFGGLPLGALTDAALTDADAALSAAAEAGEAAADAALGAAEAARGRKRAWEDGDEHDGLFALALLPLEGRELGRIGADGLLEEAPEDGDSPSSAAAARRGPSPLLRPAAAAGAAAAAGGDAKRPRLAVAGGGTRSDPRTELSDAVMNANITNPAPLIRPYALLRHRAHPTLSPDALLVAPPRALALAPRPGAGGYPTAMAGPTAAMAALAMEAMASRGYLPAAAAGAAGAGAEGAGEVRSLLDSSLYDAHSSAAAAAAAAAGAEGDEWGMDLDDPYAAAAGDVSFAPTSAGGFRDAEEMRAGGGRMSFAGGSGLPGDLSFAASSDRFARGIDAPSPLVGADGDGGLFGFYTNAPGLGGLHALGPSLGSELGFELASPSQIGSGGLDITTGSSHAAAAAAGAAAGLMGAEGSLAGPGVDAAGRPSAAERARLDRAHTEVMTRATHTFHLIIDAAFRAADAAAAATPGADVAPGTATVLFSRALARAGARTRREAAVSFVQLLALRALGFLTTRQNAAYGEIVIGRGPKWMPPAQVPVGKRVKVAAFGTPTSSGAAPADAAAAVGASPARSTISSFSAASGAGAGAGAGTGSPLQPSARRSIPGPFARSPSPFSRGGVRRPVAAAGAGGYGGLERVSEESTGDRESGSSRSQPGSPARGSGAGGARGLQGQRQRRFTGDFSTSESGSGAGNRDRDRRRS